MTLAIHIKNMFHRFYIKFIEPRQHNEDLRNREFVLNILLVGTAAMLLCTIVLFVISYSLMDHEYVLTRLLGTAGALIIACLILYLSRSGRHKLASWSFIAAYMSLAAVVSACWGVSMPSAALLFGFVIMLVGVVLGSGYPVYGAVTAAVIIVGLQIAESKNIINPDLDWAEDPLNFGTVSGPFLIFGVIALVSWLFNERTEQSLRRARRANQG